ncbi:MAG: hypothetical protein AAF228_03510 [Pseudomonadota bacterium]
MDIINLAKAHPNVAKGKHAKFALAKWIIAQIEGGSKHARDTKAQKTEVYRR